MRKYILFFFLILSLVSISSCSSYRDMKINSCKLQSIDMKDFRSLILKLNIDIDNPGSKLKISDFQGEIYCKDVEIAEINCEDFNIVAHKDSLYSLSANLKLNKNITLAQVWNIVSSGNFYSDDYYLNLSCVAKNSWGFSKRLKFNNLHLSYLVK